MLNNQGYQRLVYLKIQGPKIIHIENNVNLKKRNFTVKNRPYTLRLITNATKIRTWNLEFGTTQPFNINKHGFFLFLTLIDSSKRILSILSDADRYLLIKYLRNAVVSQT